MKKYSLEAKNVMKEINIKQGETNIKYYRISALMLEKDVIDKLVQDTIRINDAMRSEEEYIEEKCPEATQYIDMHARNVFYKGCILLMLKCVYGQNAYGMRDKIINSDKVNESYPRCQSIEIW